MSDTASMSSLLTSQYPAAQPRQQDFSLQQTAMQARQAEITLTTAEGDRVTLSSSMANLQALQYSATGAGQNLSFVAASLNTASYSMSVQGDLNAQEMADIKSLVNDLANIAKDFFKGNLDQAMNKAMDIGDTGTINGFSADFTYSSMTSSQLLSGNHPIPALSQDTMVPDATTGEAAKVATAQPSITDLLRGQWEQLKNIIAPPTASLPEVPATPETTPVTPPAATTPTDTAQTMMDRATTTMTDHPRLSPFIQPLVDRVIDNLVASMPKSETARDLADRLHNAFSQAFHNWLNAA